MKYYSEKEVLKAFIDKIADLERLEELIDDFDIFSVLKLVKKEKSHSNFLSWLMNPKETHNLGGYFLKLFLKKISSKASSFEIEGPSIFDIHRWNLDDAEILREWRSIDILIKCEAQRFICVIENKIQTEEHSSQLQRYMSIIKREYKKYDNLFVYLTIEGATPSEGEYIPFSYSEILALIERIVNNKKHELKPEVLVFISHYKEMLRREFMEDSEIQEICRNIYRQHKRALDLIFEYRPDILQEIYEHLVDIIEKDPDLKLAHSSKSYIRFIPKNLDSIVPKKGSGWAKIKRILLFEIKNDPKKVDLDLLIGPGPQEIRSKLYKIAKGNLGLFNIVGKRKLTKQWFAIYKKPLISDYEDKDVDEIKAILEEKLNAIKSSDFPKIEKEIKKFTEK